MIDPAAVADVHDSLLAYVRLRFGVGIDFAEPPAALGRGFDTYIYTFSLRGDALDDEWRQPLVLRVYSTPEQSEKAEREASIQAFAAGVAYPALKPLAIDGHAPSFGLPIMVMRRVNGGTVLQGITSKPWRAKALLARMADLHADLHALPTAGCPLPYEGPLVERKLAELRDLMEEHGAAHMVEGYRWLDEHKAVVATEDAVLCHDDFHPLNVMEETGGAMTVIDWSDAALGDRHCDVARTVALIWFSQIAATSAVERTLLKLARGYLRGCYFNRYNERMPVDQQRLAYWETLHTFWGWAQLEGVAARSARGEKQTEMAEQIPAGTLAVARDRFWKLASVFG